MWGFILFGQEYGFSFYWMFKIIAIIMISIEIVLKITKKIIYLLIAGGLLLALAPAMVWWFSSSIVDGYIYGMGAVLLFGYYMNNLDIKIWKKNSYWIWTTGVYTWFCICIISSIPSTICVFYVNIYAK